MCRHRRPACALCARAHWRRARGSLPPTHHRHRQQVVDARHQLLQELVPTDGVSPQQGRQPCCRGGRRVLGAREDGGHRGAGDQAGSGGARGHDERRCSCCRERRRSLEAGFVRSEATTNAANESHTSALSCPRTPATACAAAHRRETTRAHTHTTHHHHRRTPNGGARRRARRSAVPATRALPHAGRTLTGGRAGTSGQRSGWWRATLQAAGGAGGRVAGSALVARRACAQSGRWQRQAAGSRCSSSSCIITNHSLRPGRGAAGGTRARAAPTRRQRPRFEGPRGPSHRRRHRVPVCARPVWGEPTVPPGPGGGG